MEAALLVFARSMVGKSIQLVAIDGSKSLRNGLELVPR